MEMEGEGIGNDSPLAGHLPFPPSPFIQYTRRRRPSSFPANFGLHFPAGVVPFPLFHFESRRPFSLPFWSSIHGATGGGGQFAASISPEISLQICPFVFNPSLSTSSTDLFTAQHNADSHFNAIGNEGEMKGIYLYGRMDG